MPQCIVCPERIGEDSRDSPRSAYPHPSIRPRERREIPPTRAVGSEDSVREELHPWEWTGIQLPRALAPPRPFFHSRCPHLAVRAECGGLSAKLNFVKFSIASPRAEQLLMCPRFNDSAAF